MSECLATVEQGSVELPYSARECLCLGTCRVNSWTMLHDWMFDRLSRAMGLRHLCVTNIKNEVVGVLTRCVPMSPRLISISDHL